MVHVSLVTPERSGRIPYLLVDNVVRRITTIGASEVASICAH